MGIVSDEALKATAEKVVQVLALRSPGVAQVSEHFAVGAMAVLVGFRRQGQVMQWDIAVYQQMRQGPVEVCCFWNTPAGIQMRESPWLAGLVNDVQQALVQVLRPGWE